MPALLHILTAKPLRLTLCFSLVFSYMFSAAQVCSDPVNTVYGLTNGGFIYPINVNTGVVGAAINPTYPGNAPDQSNGIGYNALNGKFYYFKRIPSSAPIEFVSFDPATNTYQILSSPATASSVYSGSITNDGSGYYMWDTQGRLFYYKISTDTWTSITTSLVDQFGKDVDSIIRAHASGDGAIDGSGNLWILPSSDTRYGLFRLNAPLPTTAVASVTVQQLVPMQVPPAKFVGISFTHTGEIFMITSTNKMYRLEDNLSLTLMSTMTSNMGDLTSCNFPMFVLAAENYALKASLFNGTVKLSWLPSLQTGAVYFVERSIDNRTWKVIATSGDLDISVDGITYVDEFPSSGKNYYRIRVQRPAGKKTYSNVKMIGFENEKRFAIWPNPVKSDLYIQNAGENAFVTVFSEAGSKVKTVKISSGVNGINFDGLPSGRYFITVRSENGKRSTYKIIKK
ncbi:MAG: T9SS type A sorting domain-containing protein [Chitinophagaceae bacterium]|nr:T9SS type A sorting domain-containing protein [Chitinophagaceae bacterium]